MAQEDHILKSGAKLHMSSAPWELTCNLYSAVKGATLGKKTDPEVGDIIMAAADVRKAVNDLLPFASYDNIVIQSAAFFDDPKQADKVRPDYLEICDKLIIFHLRPFFLMTSSKSTGSGPANTKNQEQP